eukprot:3332423-Rhodomonas_salina.4
MARFIMMATRLQADSPMLAGRWTTDLRNPISRLEFPEPRRPRDSGTVVIALSMLRIPLRGCLRVTRIARGVVVGQDVETIPSAIIALLTLVTDPEITDVRPPPQRSTPSTSLFPRSSDGLKLSSLSYEPKPVTLEREMARGVWRWLQV